MGLPRYARLLRRPPAENELDRLLIHAWAADFQASWRRDKQTQALRDSNRRNAPYDFTRGFAEAEGVGDSETELKLMAGAGQHGVSSQPKNGYKRPAQWGFLACCRGSEGEILADVFWIAAGSSARARTDAAQVALNQDVPALSMATSVPFPWRADIRGPRAEHR